MLGRFAHVMKEENASCIWIKHTKFASISSRKKTILTVELMNVISCIMRNNNDEWVNTVSVWSVVIFKIVRLRNDLGFLVVFGYPRLVSACFWCIFFKSACIFGFGAWYCQRLSTSEKDFALPHSTLLIEFPNFQLLWFILYSNFINWSSPTFNSYGSYFIRLY